jgi:hypothetical protein
MKKNAALKAITVLFLGLGIVACDNDDSPAPAEVKLADANGDFTGKLGITQGTKKSEVTTQVTTKDSTLTFAELPVRQAVFAVIKDSVKTDSALTTLGKVKYVLNYTAKVNAGKTAVDLTFKPKTLEMQVPVDGANKKVVVTFEAKTAGSYTGKDKVLKAEMEAVKITVDGTQVTPFDKIVYSLPAFTKK